ncbi:unnamed protein product [Prorocentrum cordatum]|uniref:Uncharacterized protein n=1 Tax=Prorocentrum cordatum TaxID=2364126 RepID=A0ABN9U995_9DINO|nr:unnamed protein product [Polarella glacialis]
MSDGQPKGVGKAIDSKKTPTPRRSRVRDAAASAADATGDEAPVHTSMDDDGSDFNENFIEEPIRSICHNAMAENLGDRKGKVDAVVAASSKEPVETEAKIYLGVLQAELRGVLREVQERP